MSANGPSCCLASSLRRSGRYAAFESGAASIKRRLFRTSCWPRIVRLPLCANSWRGLFGADGHAPVLHYFGVEEDDASLEPPAYSQSAKPEFVEATKSMMTDIIALLVRCGVKARGATVREYATRRAASTYPASRDGVARREIRLELPEGLSFIQRVGFRYCVDKSLRATAAAVYWRTIDSINRQRLWMADRIEALHGHSPLSFRETRALAAAELRELETPVFAHYSLLEGHDRFSRLPTEEARRFRPLHRDSCDFPSPAQLFRELGVRDWFAGASGETGQAKRYCNRRRTHSSLADFESFGRRSAVSRQACCL